MIIYPISYRSLPVRLVSRTLYTVHSIPPDRLSSPDPTSPLPVWPSSVVSHLHAHDEPKFVFQPVPRHPLFHLPHIPPVSVHSTLIDQVGYLLHLIEGSMRDLVAGTFGYLYVEREDTSDRLGKIVPLAFS